ncbi:MAG: metallophosphoesterase family protein, partial [Hyphomicrobiaceae bacterium]
MFTLAHISDVHLAPMPAPELRHLLGKRLTGFVSWHVFGRKKGHRRDTLDALITDLKTRVFDHLALTGDLVNIALPQEFEASAPWVADLGGPGNVSFVPGNHDIYRPVSAPGGIATWGPYMRSNPAGEKFAASLSQGAAAGFPYVRVLDNIALIGVSSAIPTLPFIAAGELGEAQRSALVQTLKNLDGTDLCRVLLIHHPPLPGLAV